jgi:sugar phosphate isomerase/epimerase
MSETEVTMRLGGPVYEKFEDPQGWLAALKRLGYGAAYSPVNAETPPDVVHAYRDAAAKANVVIAEVGAWSNPLSKDEAERAKATKHCQTQLHLADELGARCCVNIAGSRGPQWDGPDASHYTADVFDMIVESVRKIIDAVKPKNAFYTLEPMPWAPPDSPDSYLALIKAIDRRPFAAHLDPVNMITSPQRYYANADFLRECFAKLGPHIKSCHAKDIVLQSKLTVHLDEARPGLGGLDFATFLREVNKLDPDSPVMVEHLPTAEDYKLAADHIREVAKATGLKFV